MEATSTAGRSGTYGRSALLAIVICALALSAVLLQSNIDKEHVSLGLHSNGIKSNASTLFELLGGLRTAAAAYLWIKLDRVHDDYYGNLRKEEELMPLIRIVAWLNPKIEDSYYEGAYMLYLFKKPNEAWSFAIEGLQANPDSSKMELNVGQLALFSKHDYTGAIFHLKRAYALAQDSQSKLLALQSLKGAYMQAGMPGKAHALEGTIATVAGDERQQAQDKNSAKTD